MATKDHLLSIDSKKVYFRDERSLNDGSYSNLNLNQNNKCSNLAIFSSTNVATDTVKFSTYGNEKNQKAYENSVEGATASSNQQKVAARKLNNKWKSSKQILVESSVIQSFFELPRQQKNVDVSKPEVAQFKASQTLLNPNQQQIPTVERQPLCQYHSPQRTPQVVEENDISNFITVKVDPTGKKRKAAADEDVGGVLAEGCGTFFPPRNETPKGYIKNGCYMDDDCDVLQFAHVLVDADAVNWQAHLGTTDIATNKNQFYLLQLLKHDRKEDYYVFRKWGRVGSRGGWMTKDFDRDLQAAKKFFEKIFNEKTGCDWGAGKPFNIIPLKMAFLDMYVEEKDQLAGPLDIQNSHSTLDKPIQDLMAAIFHIKLSNESLKSFVIDLQRMPLGKISKNQIEKGMAILKEISNILEVGHEHQSLNVLEASNRFYTFIPHACGSLAPPLIDSSEIVAEKMELLNSLRDVEVAYSTLKEDPEDGEKAGDIIDSFYSELRTTIKIVTLESEMYKLIEAYIQNTSPPSHEVDILQVFSVDNGQAMVATEIGNRHLLWHGSRLSNFAGILSKGLKIAPPETPSNGNSLGKGIYFADMIAKAFKYCKIGDNGEAYLILAEVGLGRIQEQAAPNKHIIKPKDKSSVKGLGQIIPDDAARQILEDGVIVPSGKAKISESGGTFKYNEYVVYDTNQVKIRYIVRAKFTAK